jgi:two-component system response regulator YesN
LYRILIIDDEPVVREGIAENIDWQTYGFELAGTCRDGREAMQAIEDAPPDVILTDICMPFVDGLELASFVADRYPATKTILLTGFDEFEYAQEAVKLRVHSFLLKPITPTELTNELQSVRRTLDVERNRDQQLERMRGQLRESLPVLRERLLNRILHGEIDPADIDRRLATLDLELPGPAYAVIVCDPDTMEAEEELAEIAVQTIAEEVVEESDAAFAFATPRARTVVVVSAPSPAVAASFAVTCADAISERVATELGITVSVGIGEPVGALAAIGESYNQARTALDHRIVLGPNQIIGIEQVRGSSTASASPPTGELRSRYVVALKTGSESEARSALDALLDSCGEREVPPEVFQAEMHRLLADVMTALESIGVDYRQVPGVQANPFERLGHIKTIAEVRTWFADLTTAVHEHLSQGRDRHSHVKAVEAEEYIRSNYADGDLSLASLCRELAISKSYFSPLFKEHTGMTFVEFLTAIRMDRARELLANEDLKTYEVAQSVGFSDPHYFSLTFKKQTGLSPTEFRNSVRDAS